MAALVASGECSRIFCLVRAPDTESAQRRVEEVQKPRVQNFDLFNVDLSVQFNPINRFFACKFLRNCLLVFGNDS